MVVVINLMTSDYYYNYRPAKVERDDVNKH
jgi:hypothetical protein